ncbi:MAG: hypothetical protein R2876_04460 [Eubacteriales bacterium]
MVKNKKLKKFFLSIDKIDKKIISLLEQRMHLTQRSALLKWRLGKQVPEEYYFYNLVDKATCFAKDGGLIEFDEALLHFINFTAKKYEKRIIQKAQREYRLRRRKKRRGF